MATPPDSLARSQFIDAVDHALRQRKSAKAQRDPLACSPDHTPADFFDQVRAAVEVAGWAPFHKVAHKEAHFGGALDSVVPWRFYLLDAAACCRVVAYLRAQAEANPDSVWSKAWQSKIPKLLAGAGALVLVTWLPDPAEGGGAPTLTDNNIEHIAAAGAAVQSLLLAAEARAMHTYWSSGGILATPMLFERLGVPLNQKLLAAVFLAPESGAYDAIEGGGLRDKRGGVEHWAVELSGE
jgi:nitroreductase